MEDRIFAVWHSLRLLPAFPVSIWHDRRLQGKATSALALKASAGTQLQPQPLWWQETSTATVMDG